MKNHVAIWFVSLSYVGFLKPFSATWGSLASGLLLFWFWPDLELSTKLLIILLLFGLGCLVTDFVERQEKIHDPHFIVIDELVGMMIVCFFLPQVWWQWVMGFLLFRFFDITKLWPASVFDKKSGGFAIMFDDVIAAFWSTVALLPLMVIFNVIFNMLLEVSVP